MIPTRKPCASRTRATTAMIEHPEELSLSVLTVRRQPQYVHKTLASLLAADALVHRLGGIDSDVGAQVTDIIKTLLNY